MSFKDILKNPCAVGVIADRNNGKSMLLYNIIDFSLKHSVPAYAFGLEVLPDGVQELNTLEQLERLKDCVVIVDEFGSFFNLKDGKSVVKMESVFRRLHHDNKRLILSGTPDNFNKFVSSNLDVFAFKGVTFKQLVNGSSAKEVATSFKGQFARFSFLDVPLDKVLLYDRLKHSFSSLSVPYLEQYDTKKNNKSLF